MAWECPRCGESFTAGVGLMHWLDIHEPTTRFNADRIAAVVDDVLCRSMDAEMVLREIGWRTVYQTVGYPLPITPRPFDVFMRGGCVGAECPDAVVLTAGLEMATVRFCNGGWL